MDQRLTSTNEIEVSLGSVIYDQDPDVVTQYSPHGFHYTIMVRNCGSHMVTVVGHKWILRDNKNAMHVFESDTVQGQQPCLGPGRSFRYIGCHTIPSDILALGSFLCLDEDGYVFPAHIPNFYLKIPQAAKQLN